MNEQERIAQIRERQRTRPIEAVEDIEFLLSLLDRQAAGAVEDLQTIAPPPDFKWPKPTLAGYDYALSMAELNGFDNVTHAIITAVKLRDAGVGLIQLVAEEIAADLGYQGGYENQRDLTAAIQKAINDTATRMRDACVAKVGSMAEQWRQEASKAGRMFSDKTNVATQIATALESIELDQVEQSSELDSSSQATHGIKSPTLTPEG